MTLQIIFNFPFESVSKLITIAQFTKQSRIIQHPMTREEKNLNQHSKLNIFPARYRPHIAKISPPESLTSQLFFRNFTISSINKPSNYKIARIYPSSRACGWRWCAEQEVEWRHCRWGIYLRRSNEKILSKVSRHRFDRGLLICIRIFFVRTFAKLLPIWTTVHPISNRNLQLPDSVTSLGYIEIYFVYRRYNLRGLIPCNDPACHEPETSSAFSFAAG